MKIVLSTDNVHKLQEFREMLEGSGIELVSKSEVGCHLTVEENGATFEENAYLKAAAVCEATGLPAIADDSGLCVDALDGAPGLYSARFTGDHEDSDAARRRFLLEKMEGISQRQARFVCALCCVFPNGDVLRANGSCEGEILTEEIGTNGFGYNAVFRPAGWALSMAQMSAEEKNSISHRGNALKAFKKEWESYHDKQ